MARSKAYLGNINIEKFLEGNDDIYIYLGNELIYPINDPQPQTVGYVGTYSDGTQKTLYCEDLNGTLTSGDTDSTSGLTDVAISGCITTIDAAAFRGCSTLSGVTLSSGLVTIGANAFRSCSALTSINIPDTVETFGDSAFKESGLLSVVIPSAMTVIGRSAFGRTPLSSVTIHEGVTEIERQAFDAREDTAQSLEHIVLPSTITTIGQEAFYGRIFQSFTCLATTPPSLGNLNPIDSLVIYVPCGSVDAYKAASGWSTHANRIQAIPNSCPKLVATYSDGSTRRVDCDGNTTLTTGDTRPSGYDEYSAMTSAVIGDCVTSIDNYAFKLCISLTSIIIPDGVTSMGYEAFGGCTSLTSCTLSSGVTSIGDNTFLECYNLSSINIPDSVTSIGRGAFSNCTSLTTVEIGSGITAVGGDRLDGAFQNCTSLVSFTIKAVVPPTINEYMLRWSAACPIYVPAGSVEAYKTASGWSTYASRIQAIPTE